MARREHQLLRGGAAGQLDRLRGPRGPGRGELAGARPARRARPRAASGRAARPRSRAALRAARSSRVAAAPARSARASSSPHSPSSPKARAAVGSAASRASSARRRSAETVAEVGGSRSSSRGLGLELEAEPRRVAGGAQSARVGSSTKERVVQDAQQPGARGRRGRRSGSISCGSPCSGQAIALTVKSRRAQVLVDAGRASPRAAPRVRVGLGPGRGRGRSRGPPSRTLAVAKRSCSSTSPPRRRGHRRGVALDGDVEVGRASRRAAGRGPPRRPDRAATRRRRSRRRSQLGIAPASAAPRSLSLGLGLAWASSLP